MLKIAFVWQGEHMKYPFMRMMSGSNNLGGNRTSYFELLLFALNFCSTNWVHFTVFLTLEVLYGLFIGFLWYNYSSALTKYSFVRWFPQVQAPQIVFFFFFFEFHPLGSGLNLVLTTKLTCNIFKCSGDCSRALRALDTCSK